jgi:hypothetical protein
MESCWFLIIYFLSDLRHTKRKIMKILFIYRAQLFLALYFYVLPQAFSNSHFSWIYLFLEKTENENVSILFILRPFSHLSITLCFNFICKGAFVEEFVYQFCACTKDIPNTHTHTHTNFFFRKLRFWQKRNHFKKHEWQTSAFYWMAHKDNHLMTSLWMPHNLHKHICCGFYAFFFAQLTGKLFHTFHLK